MQYPETKPTKQIFISYSRTDLEACIVLRSALEQAGLSVFQDEDAIRVGDRWVTQLEQALKNCSAFVLLVGREGIQRWVGAEVQIALNRHLSPHNDAERLPIFPILLDEENPESLPPFLALFQSDQWVAGDPLPDTLIEAIKHMRFAPITDSLLTVAPFLVSVPLTKMMRGYFLDGEKKPWKRWPVLAINNRLIQTI